MTKNIADWFKYEVYYWRSGAAVVWSSILVYPSVAIYQFFAAFSLSPFKWLSGYIWSLLSLQTWFSAFLLALTILSTSLWNIKYASVRPKIFTQRWQFYYTSPADIPFKVTYYIAGGFSVWCLLNTFPGEYASLKYQVEGKWYLNERYLFMMLHGVFVAIMYCRKFYLDGGNYLKFPVTQEAKFLKVKAALFRLVWQSILTMYRNMKYYYLIYYIFAGGLCEWFSSSLNCSRSPIPVNSVYGMLDLSLLWQTLLSGVTVNFLWSLSSFIFKVYNTEPYEFPIESSFKDGSFRTLANAMDCSSDPLVKHLVFQDFCRLSKYLPDRRKVVFSLSQPGGHPHNWKTLSSQCLLSIESLSQAVSVFNTQLIIGGSEHHGRRERFNRAFIKSVSANETRNTTETPLSYSSWTDYSNILSPTSSFVGNQSNTLTYRGGGPVTNGMNVSIITAPPPTVTFSERFKSYIRSRPLMMYFCGDIPDSKSCQLFSDSPQHMWAVEGISNLVSASFTEDSCGVVQQSLPDIIDTLLTLNEAIDKHFKVSTGISRHSNSGDGSLRFALRSAVKSSLYKIIDTFKEHITNNAIQVSMEQLRKLKMFLEYKE